MPRRNKRMIRMNQNDSPNFLQPNNNDPSRGQNQSYQRGQGNY